MQMRAISTVFAFKYFQIFFLLLLATTASKGTPPVSQQAYIQVATGSNHSLALSAEGIIYAWGSNSIGQLGDGTTLDRLTPVLVSLAGLPANTRFTCIAAGSSHSLAVSTEGKLYSWGNNYSAQLGDGTFINRSSPTQVNVQAVPVGTRFSSVAASSSTSMALTTDGKLYVWGNNILGTLGDGSTNTQTGAVAVSLQNIPPNTRFKQIANGVEHSVVLSTDGVLYAWGENSLFQVGDATITRRRTPIAVDVRDLPVGTRFAQISCGAYHTLALGTDGTLYAWGFNGYGAFGDDNAGDGRTPNIIRLGGLPTGTSLVQIAGIGYHSLALASNGALYTWGRNNYGQLGDGTFAQRNAPVRESSNGTGWIGLGQGASANHSLVLGPGGGVFSAGLNNAGQLGDGTVINSPIFVRNQLPLATSTSGQSRAKFYTYPIPAHGSVRVRGALAGTALMLLDVQGRLVQCVQAAADGSATLVLPPTLPVGLYILHNAGRTLRLPIE
jgi:alpha-tubulin suppressor-like RCC1 family protein